MWKRETAKVKKSIRQIFKENKLYTVIQCKMKIVDYFDVSLNWNNWNYKPYHKSDVEILYIHKDSNHPQSILKHIPTLVEKTISTFWSDENIFNESANILQKNLSKNIQIPTSATLQIKSSILLNGQCFAESIVYQANITVNILDYKEKVYLGVSKTTFKVCYVNHKKSLTK